MKQYPYLEIHPDTVRANAAAVCGLCREHGIAVAGVIKFSDGSVPLARAYMDGGCTEIASSRISHLSEIKRDMPQVPTLLIRAPMLCEVEETVLWCDTSLNTDLRTLRALDAAAARQGRRHGVILLLDVGDLREGVLTEGELCAQARTIERKLPHLRLKGVGSTFGCYGAVLPDRENLSRLVQAAELVEQAIGRRLELISGGSSSSLLPLCGGELPQRINHLRVGGFIANPISMRLNRGFILPGVEEDTVFLRAQIIEVNDKPTAPAKATLNWAGNPVHYEDRGVRRRAIAALGAADVGDVTKLLPVQPGVRILGGSSDHLILDISECAISYQTGDEVTFRMFYGPLLHAFTSRLVKKVYIQEEL